jgi:hypothetical protein
MNISIKKEDSKHGDLCCWNQIVGLPKKGNEGTEKAIFDYEMDILRLLEGGEKGEMYISFFLSLFFNLVQ